MDSKLHPAQLHLLARTYVETIIFKYIVNTIRLTKLMQRKHIIMYNFNDDYNDETHVQL